MFQSTVARQFATAVSALRPLHGQKAAFRKDLIYGEYANGQYRPRMGIDVPEQYGRPGRLLLPIHHRHRGTRQSSTPPPPSSSTSKYTLFISTAPSAGPPPRIKKSANISAGLCEEDTLASCITLRSRLRLRTPSLLKRVRWMRATTTALTWPQAFLDHQRRRSRLFLLFANLNPEAGYRANHRVSD